MEELTNSPQSCCIYFSAIEICNTELGNGIYLDNIRLDYPMR